MYPSQKTPHKTVVTDPSLRSPIAQGASGFAVVTEGQGGMQ